MSLLDRVPGELELFIGGYFFSPSPWLRRL